MKKLSLLLVLAFTLLSPNLSQADWGRGGPGRGHGGGGWDHGGRGGGGWDRGGRGPGRGGPGFPGFPGRGGPGFPGGPGYPGPRFGWDLLGQCFPGNNCYPFANATVGQPCSNPGQYASGYDGRGNYFNLVCRAY